MVNYSTGFWGFCNEKYGNALYLSVLQYFLDVECMLQCFLGVDGKVPIYTYLSIDDFG